MPSLDRPSIVPAINSILAQAYTNWELLVMGNGNPPELPSDPRIKYFTHTHSEDRQKLNCLTDLATGDILNFAADDDTFGHNALGIVAAQMTKQWCVGRIRVVPTEQIIGRPCTFEQLVQANRIPCPAVYWTREAADKVGKWRPSLCGDYDYWLRMWTQVGSPHFIPAVLSNYFLHEGQDSSRFSKETEIDAELIRQQYLNMV